MKQSKFSHTQRRLLYTRILDAWEQLKPPQLTTEERRWLMDEIIEIECVDRSREELPLENTDHTSGDV